MTRATRPNREDLSAAAFWSLVAAATALGAGLRFFNLSSRDFWFDESCTFIYVHNLFDWPEGSNLLVESTNLPYYVLLRGWTRVFGESEASFRSLSALASVMTLPLLALAGARIARRRAGALCAIFAALHPLAIYYAQEARAYALWMLMLTGCTLALVEALRRQRPAWWAGFGGALLFTLHLHYFTIFWAAASAAAVLLAADRGRALRAWAVTVSIVAALFLPYFCAAILPAAGGGGSIWIGGGFDALAAIPRTLWALLPAGGYPAHLRGLSLDSPDTMVRQPMALVLISQVLPAVIVATVMLRLFVRREALTNSGASGQSSAAQLVAPGGSRAATVALTGLTLGPLLLALIYSLMARPIYLAGRYDLVAWPAALILLSVLISEFASRGKGSRGARTALVVVPLVGCGLVPVHRLLAQDPPASFHRVRAEHLAGISEGDSLVIAFSYDRDYLQYYLHRAGFAGTIRSFPTWLERQVGWVDTASDTSPGRLTAASEDAAALVRQAEQVLLAGGRAMVLTDSVDPQGQSPRADLNRTFLRATEARGLDIAPLNLELGIYELRRSP